MIFEQIKAESSDNLSYIVGDEETHEAAIVDPSYSAQKLIEAAENRELAVKYVVDTHSHRDHTRDNEPVAKRFGAKIAAHRNSAIRKDVSVEDGDVLKVGGIGLTVIHTPGHSPDSICLLAEGKLLTGDTLFVGECGRTDIPGGNAEELYHSLFDRLLKLDDETEVYPGHQYRGGSHSTIGEEKRTNYVLADRTLEEFLEFSRGIFTRSVWVGLETVDE